MGDVILIQDSDDGVGSARGLLPLIFIQHNESGFTVVPMSLNLLLSCPAFSLVRVALFPSLIGSV